MNLTYAQKQHFLDHGYVRVPGVVAPAMVAHARRAINAWVGQGMDPAKMERYRAQSYAPEVQGTPPITDLFNKTPARDLAESAIGPGKIRDIRGGQIALRFPTTDDRPNPPRPHIDGMYSPTNGVPEGTIANFTALLGVMLSDVPEPMSGNFTVWPGTHRLYADYFRRHGPQSLMNGMPKVDLPPYVPVTGNAGDVVLAHYLLGHGISPNTSPNVRYMIFFRLTHVDHDQTKWDSMTDPWLQWEGMKDLVTA